VTKKKWLAAAAVVVFVLMVIQLVPVQRTNPPVVSPLEAPPEVMSVVNAACASCHSHATEWPWYSRVAPVSWLVAHDVEEAREHLNLSTWGGYDASTRVHLRDEMWEEVEDGEMPPLLYRIAHPEARLSDAQLRNLREWASGSPSSS
jgi:hypothetical protein